MAAENRVEVLLTAKDKASGAINKNTKAMKGMTAASKTLGDSLKTLKGVAVTAFAGWGVSKMGSSIIKIGADFKYTMAIVKGVSQATAKEYEALEAIARKMGETTEWSATEAAEALKFLSMAGFKAEKAIKALPATLNLATAGNIDLGRTADIVTNALTAMLLPVEELTRVSDVFIQTITSSNTNMEMMAESFKYAAPVAAAFGVKIERLSALIGLLGNAGIQGSMAGTQLSMAMMKAQETFKKYNVSAKRADGSTKDFVDALELLESRGGDVNEILSVFAMRSGKAALALLGQGVPAIMKYIKEIEKAEGATKKLADIIRDTAKIDWKILISVLESVAIDIWEKYEESAIAALKTTAKWVGENREKIVELSKVVGGLAETVDTTLIPALNKIWSVIAYDPAILEWGLIGLALGGKKGAAIGAALGHMMSWVENLSRALALVSTGILRLSDVANANFKELQDLVKNFEIPDPLKDLQLQAEGLRQEIEYLKKATEGKVLVFAGDKERLIGLGEELGKVQAYIETLEKAKDLDIISDQAINQAKRLSKALEDPAKYFDKVKKESGSTLEQMKEYYKQIESDAKELRDSEEEIEDEKTRVFEENLTYRLKIQKEYYKQIEATAKELRDAEEEAEDEQIRIARELAEYHKKTEGGKYDDMKSAMMGWANSFSSTLNDMLWGAEVTFKSILESFMKMITQMMIQKYLIESMFTGEGWGWIGSLLGAAGGIAGGGKVPGGTGPITFAAQGGIFPGGINAYSNQIVKTPTQFAFAGGAGLMGEAGPEAIIPLTRTPDGDLGVKAEGGGTTIIINAIDTKSFADVVQRNPESIIEVVGDALEGRTGLLDKMRRTL